MLRALGLAFLLAAPALAQESPVLELSETVAGRPVPDYAALWWQWAFSMPQDQSPVRDDTGALCHVGQEGPVWFLAGGYGTSRIERRCTVPAGRHLFFPVINVIVVNPPGYDRSCADTQAQAAANNDRYVYVRVSLDGVELPDAERFRIAPKACFEPFALAPPKARVPHGALAATDGYWIMLRPLPPGEHRLEFRAFYTLEGAALGNMVQNIAYDLTVTAAP